MTDLLKRLCELPGISGREQAVREALAAEVAPYADRMYTDAAGNLVVFRRGRLGAAKKVLFLAHMDEVGFLVTRITEEGYLKFGTVGGFDPRVLPGRRVRIGPAGVPGVICLRAIHLIPKQEREQVPPESSLCIDIGARDRAEAEAAVCPGDAAVFDTVCTEYGQDRLLAKAIDDRLGCAVLCELIRGELAYDTYFGFTVGEEIGGPGSAFLAEQLAPDCCLICEGTTAADLPSTPAHRVACREGGGAVLVGMDNGCLYHPQTVSAVIAAAERIGAAWQPKEYVAGGTDARSVHVSARGVRCAAISAAVRSIHSAASTVSLKDARAVLDVARACTESEDIYHGHA